MSIEFAVNDRVGTVTIRRPEALNALDTAAKLALQAIWQDVDARPDVRAVILTGEGPRSFCVGTDLKEGVAPGMTAGPLQTTTAGLFGQGGDASPVRFFPLRVPVIAAINGHALGGGLELALACDIRVASRNARFGLPEAKLGSMPGAGGTVRLFHCVGRSTAMQMLLTGETIDAEHAHRVGLVSSLHEPGELMEAAVQIAMRIVRNAPLSVGAIKMMSRAQQDIGAGLEMERMAWAMLSESHDRAEGRAAFRESRSPEYTGH